ncbi:PREDICTED: ubiquitin-conjugating enzyme E2 19-like [Fragaria vesca subsp. vesca]
MCGTLDYLPPEMGGNSAKKDIIIAGFLIYFNKEDDLQRGNFLKDILKGVLFLFRRFYTLVVLYLSFRISFVMDLYLLRMDSVRLYLINSPVVREEPLRVKKEGVYCVVDIILSDGYLARAAVPRCLYGLQSELMALMMGGDSGIFVFPEEDNIFYWKGTINGSKDTVFEGTQYRLLLSFPNDYPFKPPTVKFETFCFHPNVDVRGHICLDILQKWSSAYDVRTILLSIQSSITEPNTSSPLNPQAVQLWSNQEEYRKMVVKLYKARNA